MSGIVGRGSGSPNGIPDFRPINPWGRAMPKPTRPYREKPISHALYQVEIDLRRGGKKRVGPQWAEEMAGSLAETINRALILRPDDEWGRARVVLVKPAEERDTRTLGEILLSR